MPPVDVTAFADHGLKGLGLYIVWKLALKGMGLSRELVHAWLETRKQERADDREERRALASAIGDMGQSVNQMGHAVEENTRATLTLANRFERVLEEGPDGRHWRTG